MEEFKVGDRVEWLPGVCGVGTIIETPEDQKPLFKHMGWVTVLFDLPPHRNFNMGVNPTFANVSELVRVED